MNKSFVTLLLSILVLACSHIAYTQNYPTSYPFFLWGPGLNGSPHQTTAIYSDVTHGLLVEAPKNASDNKLDISFNWRGGGTVPFIIKGNTGDVGIGTASPLYKLDVAGTLNTTNLTINQSGSGNSQIYFKNQGVLDWDLGTQVGDATQNFNLYNRGSAAIALSINKSTNNIGIGTNSPDWKLHVKGAITAEGDGAGGYADINLKNGAQRWHISGPRHGEGNRLGFFWHDGTSYFDYFSITTSGNVGIGTNKPSQKLTVNGTVYSTEVKVDVNAGTGPDYVFEPTYNLPTLAETEAYIKANKHLPEVPSAKEMETNGINLSEMNMLLLKKVEELTLHLIEQNKINERQKQLNERLQIEIKQLKKK